VNIGDYIAKKYHSAAVKVLTRTECLALGIKFPLRSGWYEDHHSREITQVMQDRLIDGLSKQARASSAAGLAVFGIAPTVRQEMRIEALANRPKKAKKKKGASRPMLSPSNALRMANAIPSRGTVVRSPKPKAVDMFVDGVHVASPEFLNTYAWATLRMQALVKYGPVCMCCGASKATKAKATGIRPTGGPMNSTAIRLRTCA
jgi:hypothetical protein